MKFEERSTRRGGHTADGSVRVRAQGSQNIDSYISLRIFDIDRKFHFLGGDIPIRLRILYTASSSCKQRPGDVRNIRQLRN